MSLHIRFFLIISRTWSAECRTVPTPWAWCNTLETWLSISDTAVSQPEGALSDIRKLSCCSLRRCEPRDRKNFCVDSQDKWEIGLLWWSWNVSICALEIVCFEVCCQCVLYVPCVCLALCVAVVHSWAPGLWCRWVSLFPHAGVSGDPSVFFRSSAADLDSTAQLHSAVLDHSTHCPEPPAEWEYYVIGRFI